ncbi:hypothetical protein GCM10010082_17740 [Kushneria pakistanensis]|uniref:DUF202 domain-containing protein n=1 Tax=Kushneria pakistanensis TaxID=1508770 RepID=A0ABQ3FIX6_9GAMM|nr:DUF202 domain-containing protein [Kushneria pakistanensis]GHC25327.1 hypothetical protein GCM10010082_17740 [Kushneria pakistanensis]
MLKPEPALDRDPGLQPERTGLAWSRTAFVMLLLSALLLRGGFAHHEPMLAWAGVALLVTTGATYAWAGVRLRVITLSSAPVTVSATWAMRVTALTVALVGVGLAASVLYHGELLARLGALMH